jgi:predicted acetyltransferase
MMTKRNIAIIRATPEYETTFRNLYQFYLYEFSRYIGLAVNRAGRYGEGDLNGCWSDDQTHPFLLYIDDELAGLAIIEAYSASETADGEPAVEMSEFFVMQRFQRQGIGEQFARRLFDSFPGRWEVAELLPMCPPSISGAR